MKITKREPKELEKSFKKIEPGTIFKYEDGVVALKIDGNEAVLLNYLADKSDRFELAKGYKTFAIKRILGKLVEIVVE